MEPALVAPSSRPGDRKKPSGKGMAGTGKKKLTPSAPHGRKLAPRAMSHRAAAFAFRLKTTQSSGGTVVLDRSIKRLVQQVEIVRESPAGAKKEVSTLLDRVRQEIESILREVGTGAYIVDDSEQAKKLYFPERRPMDRPVDQAAMREADSRWRESLDRGRSHRSEALKQIGPLLHPREAADRIGKSTVTLNTWRKQGKLLGVRLDDHEWLYPAWQFVDDPALAYNGVIGHLPEFLDILSDLHPWEQACFFLAPQPVLNGRTVLQALQGGNPAELEKALATARRDGEMGR